MRIVLCRRNLLALVTMTRSDEAASSCPVKILFINF